MTNITSFRPHRMQNETGHEQASHLASPEESSASSPDLAAPDATARDVVALELVERVKGGDRKALEALLVSVRPRLSAVALKIVRNRDDAEDVVQDAMVKVCRYIDKFEGRAALSTWLHRIVVNTAVDHLRSRRSGPIVVPAAAPQDSPEEAARRAPQSVVEETPEDLLAQAETGAWVRGGMARLSLVHREVLALRELEGESYQSIAEIARCPVGTVMSRLHHARQRLAETLAPQAPELLPRAA
jgi:RNA polymerase sigma-70 factor (ECF subfamily)